MKLGSFFMVLLVALVALGYLLSDSFHLRADVSGLQQEITRLSQAERQAKQGEQSALAALQTTTQELQSCQQAVEHANQINVSLRDENMHLKEQNRLLLASQRTSDSPGTARQRAEKTIQSTALSLFTFLILGIGSIAAIGLKSSQKHAGHHRRMGQYVCLTRAEIKELMRQRRNARSNTP